MSKQPKPKPKPKPQTPSKTMWGVDINQVIQGLPGYDTKVHGTDPADVQRWIINNTNLGPDELLNLATDPNGVAKLQAFVQDPKNLRSGNPQAQPQNVGGASQTTDATQAAPRKPRTPGTVEKLTGGVARGATKGGAVGGDLKSTTYLEKGDGTVQIRHRYRKPAQEAAATGGAPADQTAGGGQQNQNPPPSDKPDPTTREGRREIYDARRQEYIDRGERPPMSLGLETAVGVYGPDLKRLAALATAALAAGGGAYGMSRIMGSGTTAQPQQGGGSMDATRRQQLLQQREQMMNPAAPTPTAPAKPAGTAPPLNTTLLMKLAQSRELA